MGFSSREVLGAHVDMALSRGCGLLQRMDRWHEERRARIRREVVGAVRDARFSRGLTCPRCGASEVQRWGWSAGRRQRYRCVACRRTFSDFTCTPAAYLKRVELLPDYGVCLQECLSIRAAAARLGIHPSTAFRWRHRLLGAMSRTQDATLDGWIEIGSDWFAHSRKGERGITDRLPRRRGARCRLRFGGRRAYVIMACDRLGHVLTGLAPGQRVDADAIELTLAARVGEAPALTSPEGVYGQSARLARRKGWKFRQSLGATLDTLRWPAHTRTVVGYRVRLRRWLPRFHGVATKYLTNYLIWHLLLDSAYRTALQPTLMRWPLGAGFG
jgi:transposase-like protein